MRIADGADIVGQYPEDEKFVIKMHALMTQGHLKDISRDVVHEFQRTSCSHSLSVANSSAGPDCRTSLSNAVGSYVDYVSSCRPVTDNASWLKDNQHDGGTLEVQQPAPLQRLEQLESELAWLNQGRRRLAVDGDGAGRDGSWAQEDDIKTGLTRTATGVDRCHGDVKNDSYVAADGDLNTSQWILSPYRDVTAVQRRQMCGGSVLSRPTSTCVVTSCIQSLPLTGSAHRVPADPVSLRASFTDSQFHGDMDVKGGGGSPSTWSERPTSCADAGNGFESRHEEGTSSALLRTPAKHKLLSPPLESAPEHPSTPANDTNRLKAHLILDEEPSRRSHAGQEDNDAVRLNTADQTEQAILSPSATNSRSQNDSSETTDNGLKPTFWMIDYKQPKRCKKGNCTFETVSKIEFWDHLSVHYSDDKLFRCDRCPFRTPLKHHMTSHRMNHDDDKPFSCNICSYRAVSQSMVNSHKKSHSSARPYVCDYPHCHYATKFVNQLTRHQEKQHPGFSLPVDGADRRRRQSTSVPPSAAATRGLGYPDSGLPPAGLRQAAASAGGLPSLPDELSIRNAAAATMPWSIPPWSPFNFLQRMAAAAAVSGLPLRAPSPMSLAAQRSAEAKPFQLSQSTLPSTQSLELISGEHVSTSTPQKSVFARRDLLPGGPSSSPLSANDVDSRRSFLARLAAAATVTSNQLNAASEDAPVIPGALAPPADDSKVLKASRTLMFSSPRLCSRVDSATNSQQAYSGRDLSNCTSVSGYGGHAVDDDYPLDLTAKPSVTANVTAKMHREQPASVNQQSEQNMPSGTDQLSVRKTSRRKGVAHKLDTTSINDWPAIDVTDELFDVVSLSASSETITTSGSHLVALSPRGSSPDHSGTQNADKVTLNDGARQTEDMKPFQLPPSTLLSTQSCEVADASATEKDSTKSSTRFHRQPETAQVRSVTEGDTDQGDAKTDVNLYQDDGTDAKQASTLARNECRHCGFVFKHAAMFDIHMGFHKFDDPWRCNRCGQRCTDRVDFNRHVATAPHPGQV